MYNLHCHSCHIKQDMQAISSEAFSAALNKRGAFDEDSAKVYLTPLWGATVAVHAAGCEPRGVDHVEKLHQLRLWLESTRLM